MAEKGKNQIRDTMEEVTLYEPGLDFNRGLFNPRLFNPKILKMCLCGMYMNGPQTLLMPLLENVFLSSN